MVTDNKGATSVDTVSVDAIPPPCTEEGEWSGIYATPNLPYQYAQDAGFINSGVAQLNSSPWSYFYTSILLLIPECRQFSADSTKFTVYLKNPYNGAEPGFLQQIQIGLKGAGSVDWVKLNNSNTNKQIMQEDFNVSGQSTIKWY